VPIAAHRAKANLEGLGLSIDYQEFEMGHEISPLVLNKIYEFAQKILVWRVYSQFSKLSDSIFCKSASLETTVKECAIAVAAIKISASWIGLPRRRKSA
jgi:hypothetical protein